MKATTATTVTKSLKAIGVSLALLLLAGCYGGQVCGEGQSYEWDWVTSTCVTDP